jgi:hypothetical protein
MTPVFPFLGLSPSPLSTLGFAFLKDQVSFWVSHRGRRDYVLALEAEKQILKGKPVLITPHSLTKQSYA